MDLVPCVNCNRHVGVAETTCPFCARALPVQRPQFAFAGRLTRAAIFSAAAAVVACESKEAPKPTPSPVHQPGSAAGSGSSDDLEKMLDGDQRVVDHPAPVDAALSDAEAVATASDAGVPVDAGMNPKEASELATQKREALERKRKQFVERQRKDLERQHELERQNIKIQVNNKPYGAPPARRRVV